MMAPCPIACSWSTTRKPDLIVMDIKMPKRIVGQGGGSKSRLWNQIKADVLGVPYVTLKNQEQAVMGNAMLAAFGVGDIRDLKKAAGEWIRVKETFLPVKERNELYARVFEKREKMLNGPMREIFDTLAELHRG
jgi:xylulokinase